jgi:hypothetical protein
MLKVLFAKPVEILRKHEGSRLNFAPMGCQWTYAETSHGIALRYDANQLSGHLHDVQIRAAQLAEVLDLPPTAINTRAALISRAVTSFFEAGQALHQPTTTKRKKRK